MTTGCGEGLPADVPVLRRDTGSPLARYSRIPQVTRQHSTPNFLSHGHVPGTGKTLLNIINLVAALGTAVLATACVVVPVGPDGRPYGNYPTYPVGSTLAVAPLPPPAPAVAVMNARLYPANELAQSGGMAVGQVANFLDGKGAATVTIGGEQFSGEATRAGRSSREGVANAMGSRGGAMSCTYVLNNATQGSGQCTVNSGARYQLHLGG